MKHDVEFRLVGLVVPSVITWVSLYLSRYTKGVEFPPGHLLEELWYWDCIFLIVIGFVVAVGVAIRSTSEESRAVAVCTACGLFVAFWVGGFNPPNSFTVMCSFTPTRVPVPLKTPLARPKVADKKGSV